MGTVYSDQKTKWDQNDPSEMIKPIEQGGRVRIAMAATQPPLSNQTSTCSICQTARESLVVSLSMRRLVLEQLCRLAMPPTTTPPVLPWRLT